MQIYEILKQEHQELIALLNDLILLKDNDEYRFVLVEEIKNALIPHSNAEEASFYNTLRAVDADSSIVSESFKEHLEAEELLGFLELKDRVNFDWKETAIKLQELIVRHVLNEETKIFSEAQKMFSDEEAEAIGATFVSLKQNYRSQRNFKSASDMAVNMLPPRLAASVRDFNREHH